MPAARRAWWWMVAIASLSFAGCSKPRRSDGLPTYPVSGRVLLGGKPADGAQVQLWAVGSDLKRAGSCPHATVEADGSFRLTTYSTGDGAPAGDFALTLRWPLPPPPGKEQGPDRFQGRYADPAKPLRHVRIAAAKNELETIHLE